MKRAAIWVTLMFLVLAAMACSSTRDDPRVELISPGDPPSHPVPVSVSEACAAHLAPLRAIIERRSYVADLTVSEIEVFDSLLNDISLHCPPEEAQAFASQELSRWVMAIAPTYSVEQYVSVSEKCAAGLEGLRQRITSDGFESPSQAYAELEAVTGCTRPEETAVRRQEVEPALRRAGMLARSSTDTGVSPTQ